ncbi:MAG TPA: heme exporter protein CcmD [Gammaproteobacteria bacterium]|nr:heme exporter protein CcmD [Gammaproteobacteria bacterium]
MTYFINAFHMNGYGSYVWPAYGLVICLLACQLFLPWRRFRKWNKSQENKKQKAVHAQVE